MSDYDIVMGLGGRVFVLLHRGCKIAQDKILALLQELGVDASQVTFVEPDQLSDNASLEQACLIIPIDQEPCDLPEVDNAGRTCGQAGGRVVVLFGPDYSHDGLHPIAEKYGTQCGWSADQLKDCIIGGADAPRTASGAPAKRSRVGQVNC